jgi:hypothetical protein
MDPITTAIVASVGDRYGVLCVKDANAGLKSLISHKFGSTSAVAKSMADLEADPNSQARAMVLSEQVKKPNASSDADVLAAVNKLVEALAKDKTAGTSNVDIRATLAGGVAGIVGAENASIGSMTVR